MDVVDHTVRTYCCISAQYVLHITGNEYLITIVFWHDEELIHIQDLLNNQQRVGTAECLACDPAVLERPVEQGPLIAGAGVSGMAAKPSSGLFSEAAFNTL